MVNHVCYIPHRILYSACIVQSQCNTCLVSVCSNIQPLGYAIDVHAPYRCMVYTQVGFTSRSITKKCGVHNARNRPCFWALDGQSRHLSAILFLHTLHLDQS